MSINGDENTGGDVGYMALDELVGFVSISDKVSSFVYHKCFCGVAAGSVLNPAVLRLSGMISSNIVRLERILNCGLGGQEGKGGRGDILVCLSPIQKPPPLVKGTPLANICMTAWLSAKFGRYFPTLD
jgi:hypothetical protein